MVDYPRAIYLTVSDLDVASTWYTQALELQPVLSEPDAVTYVVGYCTLTLRLGDKAGASNAQVYWGVDDVAAHFRRILAIPGTQMAPSLSAAGPATAQVLDPMGNLFGLMAIPSSTAPRGEPQSDAAKTALKKVRQTVDQFQREQERESNAGRRLFTAVTVALALLIAGVTIASLVNMSTKSSDARSQFGVPSK